MIMKGFTSCCPYTRICSLRPKCFAVDGQCQSDNLMCLGTCLLMPCIHIQIQLRGHILFWFHALDPILLHLPTTLQNILHLHLVTG
jgi:hypothetical protein